MFSWKRMFGEKKNHGCEPEISAQHLQNHVFYGCHQYLGNKSQHDWLCIISDHILVNVDKVFTYYTYMCSVIAFVSAKMSDTTKRPALYDFLRVGHTPKMPITSNECSTNMLCLPIIVWSWRKGESSNRPLIKLLQNVISYMLTVYSKFLQPIIFEIETIS